MRVLYVEDNLLNAQLVRRILAYDGHEVTHAPDGRSGIEAATRQAPDVILMDLGLPGMDGYETARRLREIPALSGIPIVALTASVREIDRTRADSEGFSGYIEKPIRLDAFRKEIARFGSVAAGPGTRRSGEQ